MELSDDTLEPLRKDGEFILYRGQQWDGLDRIGPVLVFAPLWEHPPAASLKRMEHEYSLRAELDPAWAARPLALAQHGGRTLLVLEDPAGQPLDRLVGRPMELGAFLRFGTAISVALGRLHERGLIHKDIKPANVLVDTITGRAWLTGFGIASRLPRERQPLEPPESIAGTLPYMAPEQTGRMNRSIDSRSDLYSLGVTLYEMLVGDLPFAASDPMEWVHCHVARHPVPPSERVEDLPAQVSAIILKLLAKTPEERYQTAAGVEADLSRCLAAWESVGRVDAFTLGMHDASDQLVMPERLYGRDRETGALLDAFAQVVATGSPSLVLVSGYSGIGKSSLVNEVQKAIVLPRGIFISGKFDQYKRDIPYATLAQAFHVLVRHVLGKSEAEVERWRDGLREALGPNGQLIVNLIPELEFVVGRQPSVPELPPTEAESRFHMVFRSFLSVFARKEHPLAIFLDDLQWVDAATLKLLEHLVTHADVRHLLLIGAFRDNEVGASHPLVHALEAIRRTGTAMREIVLEPLSLEDVRRFVADTVRCDEARAGPLAALVYEKTTGNPFFAIQFLTALREENLLAFDAREGNWKWNLDRIQARGFTDSVLDLVVGKMKRLPATTQEALKQFACLGNSAETPTLSIAHGRTEEEVHADLWDAVRIGFVSCLDGSYKFLHDRVQEAAYSLIPEDRRAEVHLRIGRTLLSRMAPNEVAEKIFDVVNQLNRGAELLVTVEERERVAELNLIAGKRATAATAYASALAYFASGEAMLAEDRWGRRYTLSFELAFQRGESEFLTGDLKTAEARLSALARCAANLIDRAAVTRLRVTLYTTLDRSDRAVEAALEYLAGIGIAWSAHPTDDEVTEEFERLWTRLGERSIEELLKLPPMTDPTWRATFDVLIALVPPAHFTDEKLFDLIVGRMVNLSLENGACDGSSLAYVWLGMVLGPRFGDYRSGHRFGKLGLDLVETTGDRIVVRDYVRGRVYMGFGTVVLPWAKHIRTARPFLRRAFETSTQIGDLTYAAYSCNNLMTNLLASGEPLAEVEREAENALTFVRQARFGLVIDFVTAQLALVRMLRGRTSDFGSFSDAGFDQVRFEDHLAGDSSLALAACWYWIRKLQGLFHAGDNAAAIAAACEAEQLLWTSPAYFEVAEFHFYAALSRAAHCDSAPPEERPQHLEALAVHQKQLAAWAESCPENFENRTALVAAEIARLEGRESDAMRLFERAIRSARENGFIQNEALASELAGRFYVDRGLETNGLAHLRNAHACYAVWGAGGKLRQLERLHPFLAAPEGHLRSATNGSAVQQIDVTAVVKASQALSSEIVLGKLIETLMTIALQDAGADRSLLILPREDAYWIEAEARAGGDKIDVRLRQAPITSPASPEALLRYVIRTRQTVIVDDISKSNPFPEDDYLRRLRPGSILCVPLLRQGRLAGLLYLENTLTSHAFTADRVAVLELLAAQAAISLENTRLYSHLHEREAKIRRLVDSNIIGIVITDLGGGIIDANDAFLQMVGYDRDDLVSGRIRWMEMTPPEWLSVNQRAVSQMRATGTCEPFETEYVRKDGTRVSVLIGAASFERGRDEGVAFVLDLTGRKRAEDELRESERRYRNIFESSGVSIWEEDFSQVKAAIDDLKSRGVRDFREYFAAHPEFVEQAISMVKIIDVNDRTVELLAAESKDELLVSLHEVFVPETREVFVGELMTIADGRTSFEAETVVQSLTGARRTVLVTVTFPPPAARFDSVLVTLTDITERKRAQEERKRAEQALQKAQAELAHISRVTTMIELTASLAHEINQPIAAAVTNANACVRWLARAHPDVEEARAAASRMIKDATRAADIIGRIRALFKKGPPQRELVDVNEVIREMIFLLRSEATRYSISLRTELAAGPARVTADRVQLQQVFMNLMLNSIDAMKNMVPAGELTVKSHRAEKDQLLVSICDTGIGLPPDQADQIFNAFFTTKADGTGMGLPISRSIIESHGGRLWAVPNRGPGATFAFTLPIKTDS